MKLIRMIRSSICCVVKIVYLGHLAKGDFTCVWPVSDYNIEHSLTEADNGVDVVIWGT